MNFNWNKFNPKDKNTYPPDTNKELLVTIIYGCDGIQYSDVFFSAFNHKTKTWTNCCDSEIVTAWTEKPEPYKE